MASDYLKPFLGWSAGGLAAVAGVFAFGGTDALEAALLAYLVSFIFTGSNYLVIRKIGHDNHKHFYRIFLVSLALRFVLVLAAIWAALEVLEIHHIFFTVSFIISYIFHSVIEIIFLNKTLETEAEF